MREFADACAEQPGREALIAHVMLAYVRLRRQADALVLYEATRDYLATELGVDPGSELRKLHTRILRNESAAPDGGREVVGGPVPRQLPRDPTDFVGRVDDLLALDKLTAGGRTVTISAVSGMSGVGKTALATRWAHSAADRFPDGHLYLDLRGYATLPPVSTSEGLAHLIRSLAPAAPDVPADEQGAAALFRTLMAERRTLLILDNARSAEQVRPLLPGSAASVVLVTSRDTLAGLVALDGARVHNLDILKPDESYDLLAAILGTDRVEAEREAAVRLAALAGHLPLAVRILGAHLAVSPSRSIADLVAALLRASPLAEIAVDGDPRANVRAVFAQSYLALSAPQRRLFRLLGLAPGPDITTDAAAALVDGTVADVTETLRALAAAHLIDERTLGRFSTHDLVREYAYECAVAEDAPDVRSAAVDRLGNWYVDHVRAAMTVLFPAITMVAREAVHTVRFDGEADARSWLETEFTNTILMVRGPRESVAPTLRCLLLDPLRIYFRMINYSVATWLELATEGLRLAETIGEPHLLSVMHAGVGMAFDSAARYTDELEHFQRAKALAADAGWARMVDYTNVNLGITSYRLGRYEEAAEQFQEAAAEQLRANNLISAANRLGNLGLALNQLGRLTEAIDALARAADLVREHGPEFTFPGVLMNLGMCYQDAGRFDEARASIDEALGLLRVAYPDGSDTEAIAMNCQATIYRDTGRPDLALPIVQQALADLRRLGFPSAEAGLSNTLGWILCELGRTDEAWKQHEFALALAREQGGITEEAEAQLGMARILLARGDTGPAAEYAEIAHTAAVSGKLRVLEGRTMTMLAEIAAAERAAGAGPDVRARSTRHSPGNRARAGRGADPGTAGALAFRCGSGDGGGHIVVRLPL